MLNASAVSWIFFVDAIGTFHVKRMSSECVHGPSNELRARPGVRSLNEPSPLTSTVGPLFGSIRRPLRTWNTHENCAALVMSFDPFAVAVKVGTSPLGP